MSEWALEAHGLHKSYRLGKTHLHVLRGVSLQVRAGEFVAVVGASGSGKSTLLHLLGLLDRPDRGQIALGGVDVAPLSGPRRNRMRCRDIGFVFQFYHLLEELNVLENVLLPAKVDSPVGSWIGRRAAGRRRAVELLERMGLSDRLRHRPRELSGGERQRVAIARALMNGPSLLLADEPTGNLDSRTGEKILDVLREFHAGSRQTLIMVTHDPALAQRADRTLHLRDGRMD
jgi:lipoprotein-releasing system ATP-binding protein